MIEFKGKVLAYYRVSTEQQALSGLGLEGQQRAVQAYCQQRDYEIVSVFADEGASAQTPLALRKAGRMLLKTIENSTEEPWTLHLVASKSDRLWRNTPMAYAAIAELQAAKVCVHFTEDRILLGEGQGISPVERMASSNFLHMLLSMAQCERELISERTVEALASARARGEHLGAVPFGYVVVSKFLRPHEPELVTLGLILTLETLDYSAKHSAHYLNGMARPTRKGGRWTKRSVLVQRRNLRENDDLSTLASNAISSSRILDPPSL